MIGIPASKAAATTISCNDHCPFCLEAMHRDKEHRNHDQGKEHGNKQAEGDHAG
jgi:hypothetical protein